MAAETYKVLQGDPFISAHTLDINFEGNGDPHPQAKFLDEVGSLTSYCKFTILNHIQLSSDKLHEGLAIHYD